MSLRRPDPGTNGPPAGRGTLRRWEDSRATLVGEPMTETGAGPVPRCPIRLGEPCGLCVPGVTGPQDCGLVYLVQSDPELRERLRELRLGGT